MLGGASSVQLVSLGGDEIAPHARLVAERFQTKRLPASGRGVRRERGRLEAVVSTETDTEISMVRSASRQSKKKHDSA